MVHQTGGLSTIFKKVPGIYSFSSKFSMRGEFCAIFLAILGDWKLKNIDFSQKIKTPHGV